MDFSRAVLTDQMWQECEAALRAVRDPRGARSEKGERVFLEAVLYLVRTGVPWRDLPAHFGRWDAVYMRFRRWEKAGVRQGLWEQLEQGVCPALLAMFVDSTSIPVHPHAAGAPKKTAAIRLWAARGAA